MKKNGFIATSLIYSFFLVFVAIIAGLMSNYIANKTILDRYNQEVTEDLNKNTYSIILQVSNGTIDDSEAITLTNLVQNGNFNDGMNFWNNTNYYEIITNNNIKVLKRKRENPDSMISQPINLVGNNTDYYFSINVNHSDTQNSIEMYLDDTLFVVMSKQSSILDLPKYDDLSSIALKYLIPSTNGWYKVSHNFSSNSIFGNLKMGKFSTRFYSNDTYFNNIMIINLSSSFGYGLTPNKNWVDENVEWFEGTIDFIKKDKIDKNTQTSFRLKANDEYTFTESSFLCHYENDTAVSPIKEYENSNTEVTLKFASLTGNVRCTIKAT